MQRKAFKIFNSMLLMGTCLSVPSFSLTSCGESYNLDNKLSIDCRDWYLNPNNRDITYAMYRSNFFIQFDLPYEMTHIWPMKYDMYDINVDLSNVPSQLKDKIWWTNEDLESDRIYYKDLAEPGIAWEKFTIRISFKVRKDKGGGRYKISKEYHQDLNVAAQSEERILSTWDHGEWFWFADNPNYYYLTNCLSGTFAEACWSPPSVGWTTTITISERYCEIYNNAFNILEPNEYYAIGRPGGQHRMEGWENRSLVRSVAPAENYEVFFGKKEDDGSGSIKSLKIKGLDEGIVGYHLQLGNPYAKKSWDKMFYGCYTLKKDLHKYFDGYTVETPLNPDTATGEPGTPTTTYTLTPEDVDAMIYGY